MLRLEVRTLDPSINPSVTSIFLTQHVIEAPCAPPLRSLISVGSIVKFKVMSYNMLVDFMIMKNYDHCPEWCQTWEYRKQNLLREIITYEADIICLQELQDNHFDHYFKLELAKLGYCAKYKAKLHSVHTCDGDVRDGCATFFRENRFREVQEHEVNTQIYANELKKDIKLWQVATLMTALDSIADSSVPVLICCDLNSRPGSAPYDLVVHGKVDCTHLEWPDDPLKILDHTQLHHRMHLVSAYRFWQASEEHKRDINSGTEEPQCTTFTKTFSGILDYIFYSEDTLKLLGLLELRPQRHCKEHVSSITRLLIKPCCIICRVLSEA
ncbi:hypothetical protein AQUCO_00800127v1 [Aquilegia coerulea]|uniref:Endonuclease/exonuclease/phosphatase domain-containing protein n=2 Tax=Aquilegia coerulea TaxID=218851 RepID=A0A2G5EHX9_AQUCA|nr:hypothetical protein AQUCO_00800127v1 [Aquilegia coerulea]